MNCCKSNTTYIHIYIYTFSSLHLCSEGYAWLLTNQLKFITIKGWPMFKKPYILDSNHRMNRKILKLWQNKDFMLDEIVYCKRRRINKSHQYDIQWCQMVLLHPKPPKTTQVRRWIDVIAAMNVLTFPMLSFNGQNASGGFPTEATR